MWQETSPIQNWPPWAEKKKSPTNLKVHWQRRHTKSCRGWGAGEHKLTAAQHQGLHKHSKPGLNAFLLLIFFSYNNSTPAPQNHIVSSHRVEDSKMRHQSIEKLIPSIPSINSYYQDLYSLKWMYHVFEGDLPITVSGNTGHHLCKNSGKSTHPGNMNVHDFIQSQLYNFYQ